MNFEEIEIATLAYLKQTDNPLVRISTLHTNVNSKSKNHSLSLKEFTDFIAKHSEIKVMDPLAMTQDDKTAAGFEAAGFTTKPCAILASRLPSALDLSTAMLEQLESMTNALSRALEEARSTGETEKAHQIYETLERTSKLKEKIIEFTNLN
jgi:hypothetical protein